MKTETKDKSIEHFGIGIAKIVGNYSEYALLIHACDLSVNRYENKADSTHLSTTQNIPEALRLDNEIEVIYSNETLVSAYRNNVLNKVLENYIIASVSVVDGILEDLYEIILKLEHTDLSDSDVEKKIGSMWRNDNLLNFLINEDGLNLQPPSGLEMSYRETFIRYYELRILRHAIVHTSGKLSNKDYLRLQGFENETIEERKPMAVINTPLINDERNVHLTINNVLAIRKYLDRLLMYFLRSFQQEETE